MKPRIFRFDHLAPVTPTCEQLHEMAVAFAIEEFARKGAAPFMWLIAAGTHIVWLETSWDDDREKRASVLFVRQTLRAIGAHTYTQISEAWTANLSEEEFKEHRAANRSVSDLPPDKRDDVLFVQSSSRDGRHLFTRFLVTVRSRGLNFLGPRIDEVWDRPPVGQMFNLFEDEDDDAHNLH